jgi:hypothetical protein
LGTKGLPLRQPNPDELEVSVFGPGVGECIVVHLGNGEWMIVDSCVDKVTGNPAALDYLNGLGVDISRQVVLVVVTHWHDDHIRGAARIFGAANRAKFVCSGALKEEEFFRFVAGSKEQTPGGSYESEFSSILDLIENRAAPGTRPASIGPEWAFANQCLYRGSLANVHSLSPSAGTLTLSFKQRTNMLWDPPTKGMPKRRPIALGPNQTSLVLWVEFQHCNVLLGGDLENSLSPNMGWNAIILSSARPPGQAHIYKVAHHASPNADDPSIWTELLDENPLAIVTPYLSGQRPLPQKEDKKRIQGFTNLAYCTGSRTGWQTKRRNVIVERTARLRHRKLRAIEGPMGQICARIPLGSPLSSLRVRTFRGAQNL